MEYIILNYQSITHTKKNYTVELLGNTENNSEWKHLDALKLVKSEPFLHDFMVLEGTEIIIKAVVEYSSGIAMDNHKAVLLLIKGFDKYGKEVNIPCGKLAHSTLFNSYFKYLLSTQSTVQTLHDFIVPNNVVKISLGLCCFEINNTEVITFRDLSVRVKKNNIKNTKEPDSSSEVRSISLNSKLEDKFGKQPNSINIENYELVSSRKQILEPGIDKIHFSFKAFNDVGTVNSNSALISINIFDEENQYLLPLGDFPINNSIGSYAYIESGELQEPILNEFLFDVKNTGARKLEVQFHPWKKNTNTYIETERKIIFSPSSNELIGKDRAYDFINSLNPEDKIILLYTTAPYVEHETLELRPNRLAKEYIKLGYKIIFFSFSRVPEEVVMPLQYNKSLYQCLYEDVVKMSSLVANKKLAEKIFICSSFPDVYALTTISKLKLCGWKLLYEVRDDMEEFNRVGYSKWYDSKIEVAVIKEVDKVITVSPRLAQKMKVMGSLTDDRTNKVTVVQNAAPDSLIDKTGSFRTIKVANKRNNSQIIGYIGHLTPAWFDWSLIISSAKMNPNINYEIIGHGFPKNLELPENIIYLGPKTHDEFINISKRWKAGLIPFIKSPLTYGVDPNKIYEYLAVGLMVLTGDMGSVRECPATYVYDSAQEFDTKLKEIFNTKYNKHTINEIKKYVKSARWSLRAEKILEEL